MSDDRVIDAEVLEVEHETALVITSPRPAELSRELAEKSRKADEYAVDADAEATRKAYTSDFRHFVTWCDGHGLGYLPADPETIVLYLTDLAEEFKTSTMQRRLSSISVAHRRAGLTPPTASPRVARVWKGIRNRKGTKQDAKKAADAPMIRRFLSGLPDNSVRGLRDRVVILTGFYGAFRRSELVSLTVEDVVTVEEGLTIHLRRSKTDQEGGRSDDWDSLRPGPLYVPRACPPAMDRCCRHHIGSDLPEHSQERIGTEPPPLRPGCRSDREECRRRCRTRSGRVRRPLPPVRVRHVGRTCRGVRSCDHEADRPQDPGDGRPLRASRNRVRG